MDYYQPRVLVVDDEKGLRLGTKRLLEKEGFSVATAENGTDGISLGTAEEFDIAIVDMRMPDIDGIQVLKEIITKFPHTVCFITTAYASYDTAIEATKIGAFSYIPKPFTPEELLQQLRKGLEKRELYIQKAIWKKEREESLLEVAFEKTRLNTIINSIQDGVLVINKTGQAVLFNPAALKFLELKEIKIEEYVIPKLPEELSQKVNSLLSNAIYQSRSLSVQIEVKPNELFIEATSSPVPAHDGTVAGVVITLKNITELKKIEILKSQFVSMVSHELKAPIAAVYGYLKLLSDGTMNLSQTQKTTFVDRSLYRLDSLLKMVNDLLDISRMELKKTQREIKEVNLVNELKAILELFQYEIGCKKITAELKSSENLPDMKADKDEIVRLFTNLISNSIKYNKQQGRIDINIYSSDNYSITEISDTGIGMNNEESKKLFQEFFRAKNEYTKGISGTGLGLSIVKRIIDSYAGKIEVESEYNKGTTFRVYLPLEKKEAK